MYGRVPCGEPLHRLSRAAFSPPWSGLLEMGFFSSIFLMDMYKCVDEDGMISDCL